MWWPLLIGLLSETDGIGAKDGFCKNIGPPVAEAHSGRSAIVVRDLT